MYVKTILEGNDVQDRTWNSKVSSSFGLQIAPRPSATFTQTRIFIVTRCLENSAASQQSAFALFIPVGFFFQVLFAEAAVVKSIRISVFSNQEIPSF